MGAPAGTSNGPKTKGNKEAAKEKGPKYAPTRKHEAGGWGSPNPIKSQKEGQELLESGIQDGKQIYNVTKDGDIVKFQPDNTPQNGYHAYVVTDDKSISSSIAKKLFSAGKIDQKTYKKIIKNKFGGKK